MILYAYIEKGPKQVTKHTKLNVCKIFCTLDLNAFNRRSRCIAVLLL